MKKWHLAIVVLASVLLVLGCAPSLKKIPPAAKTEIFALSDSEAFGKFVEVKVAEDRQEYSYVMVYIKSLPGQFTSLEDALTQVDGLNKDLLDATVKILKKHDINQRVSLWVQLPLKDGGVSVLGHAEYDGKIVREFVRYQP